MKWQSICKACDRGIGSRLERRPEVLDAPPLWITVTFLYVPFFVIQLRKKIGVAKHLLYLALFVYLTYVISITLFPLPIQKAAIEDLARENYIRNSFIPFKDILSTVRPADILSGQVSASMYYRLYFTAIFRNVVGNILMFMPLGFLLPLMTKKIASSKRILLAGLLSSVLIEALQAVIGMIIGAHYKITSVDDVILNTLGAALGFLALKRTMSSLRHGYLLKIRNTVKPAETEA